MTHEQESHLEHINRQITERIKAKYRRGQAEHGGNLWDRPALPEMAGEVTDFNTYFVTLEQQLVMMHETLKKAREHATQLKWSETLELLDQLDTAFRLQLGPR